MIDKIDREVKVQVSKPKEPKSGQRTTPQYSIQIPKEVVLALDIEKGDKVRIYIPLKNKSDYSIKFVKKIK